MTTYMSPESSIVAQCAYDSHYIEILDSKIHYLDVGQGDPILFLHGVPTSSYLWRNIIPFLADKARCIAPDLIGMGQSDKPDIKYSVYDHIEYIEAFIQALDLRRVTVVMHGWGSVIGFNYAMGHESNIKALAFMESFVVPPIDWDMLPLPVQQVSNLLDADDGGYDLIVKENYLIERLLPDGVIRALSPEEMAAYRAPFATEHSRRVIWQYIQDVPVNGEPHDVLRLMAHYSKKLKSSNLPKLMIYAIPGLLTPVSVVKWCRDHLPNIQLVDVGDGLHYAQEDNPARYGEALASWYQAMN